MCSQYLEWNGQFSSLHNNECDSYEPACIVRNSKIAKKKASTSLNWENASWKFLSWIFEIDISKLFWRLERFYIINGYHDEPNFLYIHTITKFISLIIIKFVKIQVEITFRLFDLGCFDVRRRHSHCHKWILTWCVVFLFNERKLNILR